MSRRVGVPAAVLLWTALITVLALIFAFLP